MDDRIDIEALFEKPYYVIDILPERVPAEHGQSFFAIERYFMSGTMRDELLDRQIRFILKLNCYYFFLLGTPSGEKWERDPTPQTIAKRLCARLLPGRNRDTIILLPSENAMLTANADELHMTLYSPADRLLDLVCRLAASEGFFVRKGEADIDGENGNV